MVEEYEIIEHDEDNYSTAKITTPITDKIKLEDLKKSDGELVDRIVVKLQGEEDIYSTLFFENDEGNGNPDPTIQKISDYYRLDGLNNKIQVDPPRPNGHAQVNYMFPINLLDSSGEQMQLDNKGLIYDNGSQYQPWDSQTNYHFGDRVSYNNKQYILQVNDSQGVIPQMEIARPWLKIPNPTDLGDGPYYPGTIFTNGSDIFVSSGLANNRPHYEAPAAAQRNWVEISDEQQIQEWSNNKIYYWGDCVKVKDRETPFYTTYYSKTTGPNTNHDPRDDTTNQFWKTVDDWEPHTKYSNPTVVAFLVYRDSGSPKTIIYRNGGVREYEVPGESPWKKLSFDSADSATFPVWDNTTTYSKGSIVSYQHEGGSSYYYYAIVRNSNTNPESGGLPWISVSEYDSTIGGYPAGDIVMNGNECYISAHSANSNPPTRTYPSDWIWLGRNSGDMRWESYNQYRANSITRYNSQIYRALTQNTAIVPAGENWAECGKTSKDSDSIKYFNLYPMYGNNDEDVLEIKGTDIILMSKAKETGFAIDLDFGLTCDTPSGLGVEISCDNIVTNFKTVSMYLCTNDGGVDNVTVKERYTLDIGHPFKISASRGYAALDNVFILIVCDQNDSPASEESFIYFRNFNLYCPSTVYSVGTQKAGNIEITCDQYKLPITVAEDQSTYLIYNLQGRQILTLPKQKIFCRHKLLKDDIIISVGNDNPVEYTLSTKNKGILDNIIIEFQEQ